MNSALLISWVVTSLFLMRLFAARYRYLLVLGLPMIICVLRAFSARFMSLRVNLDLFAATVLKRIVDPS